MHAYAGDINLNRNFVKYVETQNSDFFFKENGEFFLIPTVIKSLGLFS